MELERVSRVKFNFVSSSTREGDCLYSKIGDASVGLGLTGGIIELITQQDAGLIVNSAIASIIFFGIAISNLPEYKGK